LIAASFFLTSDIVPNNLGTLSFRSQAGAKEAALPAVLLWAHNKEFVSQSTIMIYLINILVLRISNEESAVRFQQTDDSI
jgi:hypothetical protein